MIKRDHLYGVLFLVSFAFVVWVNVRAQDDPWKRTFAREDAGAYGAEVVYTLLPHLLENQRFTPLDIPPYLVVSDTSLRHTNYLFITQSFHPDEAEAKALFDHVARGNVVFVAAESVGSELLTLLELELDHLIGAELPFDSTGIREMEATRVNLLNHTSSTETGYFYSADGLKTVFSAGAADSSSVTPLGVFQHGGYNFVRVDVGQGYFLLHTAPLAFTNYNVLMDGNAEYVYAALSYMPAQATFWDRYYKPHKPIPETPLRFILSAPALRVAYFLLLSALLLFMLNRARRKQRIIPILKPKRNTTVAFTRTIGLLYLDQGDHKNLAEKMLDQFKHYVQQRLNLHFDSLSGLPAERVAARSGLQEPQVEKLLATLSSIDAQQDVDDSTLKQVASQLAGFYAGSKR